MSTRKAVMLSGPAMVVAGAALVLAFTWPGEKGVGPAYGGATRALAVAAEYFVPAGAHQAGAAGTNWRTDLQAHNCGATQASYTVYLLKRDQANGAADSRTYSLGPGQSMRYGDVVWQVFGYSGSAALRIVVTSGNVIFNSRTYNALADGTYGQFVRGQPAGEAIAYGTQGRIIQLTHNRSASSGFRTNLGFVNAGSGTIAMRVELYESGGGYLGAVQRTLRAYEYQQVDRIFEQVVPGDVSDGYAIATTTTAGGAFFAYASVVDNVKGDAIFIPAEAVAGGTVGPTPTLGGQPAYGPLVFSTQFNEQTGQPLNPGTSFPYGAIKLYGSWDFSGVTTGTGFRYDWYIDGSASIGGTGTFPGPSGRFWQTISYQNATPLSSGTYKLVIKVNNAVVLQGQCTIAGGTPSPTNTPTGSANLVPAAPEGWQYPVVPNYRAGTHTVELLSSYMLTYVDWAVANLGSQTVPAGVDFILSLDGQPIHGWTSTSSIPAGYGVTVVDYQLTVDIPVGNHTLAIAADTNHEIAESNELDNSWSKTFEWTSIVFSPPSDLARRIRGRLRPPVEFEALPASALVPSASAWSLPPITTVTTSQPLEK